MSTAQYPDDDEVIRRIRERTTGLLDALQTDTEFMRRRLEDHAARLALAEDGLAAYMADFGNAPPDHLVTAMRSAGTRLRSVQVEIGGRIRTVAVTPTGLADPAEEARRWRLLQMQLRDDEP